MEAGFIDTGVSCLWFCAPELELKPVIWVPIDGMSDALIDCAGPLACSPLKTL